MLGRSQPDARCELLLLNQALVLVIPAKKRQAQLYLHLEDLASFTPDEHSSKEYAYEVWDRGVPDGPHAVAFAIKRNRRGAAFVALLEEAVRRQRPDLLGGHGVAEIDVGGRSFIEPSELWSLVEWLPGAEQLTAVLGEVYRRARGKPEAQIRELLDHELGTAGLRWPEESKDQFVHSLAAEPPWLLRVLRHLFSGRKHKS